MFAVRIVLWVLALILGAAGLALVLSSGTIGVVFGAILLVLGVMFFGFSFSSLLKGRPEDINQRIQERRAQLDGTPAPSAAAPTVAPTVAPEEVQAPVFQNRAARRSSK